jgi:hypothetical protein
MDQGNTSTAWSFTSAKPGTNRTGLHRHVPADLGGAVPG